MSRMSEADTLVREMLTTLDRVDRSMVNFVLKEVAKRYDDTTCPNCGEYHPLDVEYMKARGWCFTCNSGADEARHDSA